MMSNDAPNRSAIIPRETWWWLGLALLMLLASWLYLRGYNVSLPFIEHSRRSRSTCWRRKHIYRHRIMLDPYFHDAAPPGHEHD